MGNPNRVFSLRWRDLFRIRPWLFLVGGLFFIRFSKGAVFLDAFAFMTKPIWPGTAQKEWIQTSVRLENQIRIDLLQKDNKRLREMLSLKNRSENNVISATVISRNSSGWWQQLHLGKGQLHGINNGDSVVGPGGLLGRIESVTPTTSKVLLLTAPGSRVGVWTARNKQHGILLGMGTNRPYLRFLNKNPQVKKGDVVSTSPASTLFPPNVPIGVIQSVDKESLPAPQAIVQLIAAPEAIDWVQIRSN